MNSGITFRSYYCVMQDFSSTRRREYVRRLGSPPPYPPITGKLQVRDFPKMQPAVVHTPVTWHTYQSRCHHLVQVCVLA